MYLYTKLITLSKQELEDITKGMKDPPPRSRCCFCLLLLVTHRCELYWIRELQIHLLEKSLSEDWDWRFNR